MFELLKQHSCLFDQQIFMETYIKQNHNFYRK